MDFKLTDEQQMIQAAARDFARTEIAPIAAELDASGEFPWTRSRAWESWG